MSTCEWLIRTTINITVIAAATIAMAGCRA